MIRFFKSPPEGWTHKLTPHPDGCPVYATDVEWMSAQRVADQYLTARYGHLTSPLVDRVECVSADGRDSVTVPCQRGRDVDTSVTESLEEWPYVFHGPVRRDYLRQHTDLPEEVQQSILRTTAPKRHTHRVRGTVLAAATWLYDLEDAARVRDAGPAMAGGCCPDELRVMCGIAVALIQLDTRTNGTHRLAYARRAKLGKARWHASDGGAWLAAAEAAMLSIGSGAYHATGGSHLDLGDLLTHIGYMVTLDSVPLRDADDFREVLHRVVDVSRAELDRLMRVVDVRQPLEECNRARALELAGWATEAQRLLRVVDEEFAPVEGRHES